MPNIFDFELFLNLKKRYKIKNKIKRNGGELEIKKAGYGLQGGPKSPVG